jgi:hypothetical protein
MGLWGSTQANAAKPKFLPVDENAAWKKQDVYATNSGWVQRAGTKASGNDNVNATPEVLVAIGGLAGTTATTGLRTASVTHVRWVTTAPTAAASTLTAEVTWDEAVTVAGSPQLTVRNGGEGGSAADIVLTYTATGSTANRKRFTRAHSNSLTAADVVTVPKTGTAMALNSGTIMDTASNTVASALVFTGVTAATVTTA